MSELRQRAPRQEDRAHLAFIRTRPCCIKHCNRQAEAAHIRMGCPAIGKPETGMQEKPDDRWTVPLCPYHHRIGADSQHANNEREWWAMRGLNPFQIATDLWKQSGGEERAAMPKPVKPPRKIKARKPHAQRRKVAAGRKLPTGRPLVSRNTFEKRPSA